MRQSLHAIQSTYPAQCVRRRWRNPSPVNDRRDIPATADDRLERTARAPGPPAQIMTLGDFELRREVGRGGMGTVYEAWQRSLRRVVAVKVLNQQVSASPRAVLRFQREAQAAAKLHHPHIVPIFGLGEENGVYYYAMEYVDGRAIHTMISETCEQQTVDTASASTSLAETVALPSVRAAAISPPTPPDPGAAGGEPLNPDSAPRARRPVFTSEEGFAFVAGHIADAADALAYAHQEGVIHRDIKPHNLLLGKDNKLRISDFGLARLVQEPGVTITGELIGSPLYMSPEQITGDSSKLDHRTDIYSLGATLYEWLTFVPPYPGETREQVISRILTSEPLGLRAHDPRIPVDLETICLKAIERDRFRRYATAGELRDDLRRFLANRPIRARRASVLVRARKFVARHQVASLGGAAVLVAAMLSAALLSKQRQVKQQTAVAARATEDAARWFDLITQLPLELRAAQTVAEKARPVLESVVSGGAQSVNSLASIPWQGSDPVQTGKPLGIARRAAREMYAEFVQDRWPSDVPGATDETTRLLGRAFSAWDAKPDLAMDLISVFLEKRSDHYEAVQFRTALCGRLARDKEMARDADMLVRLRSSEGASYLWRAMARLFAGETPQAMSDLAKAASLNADRRWLHALKGLVLAQAAQELDAISAFDEALGADRDFAVARLGRAYARAALGNAQGAIVDLSRVIELEPGNASVYVLRGDQFFDLFDFGSAEQDYDRALKIGGSNLHVNLRYAVARTRQGHAQAVGGEGSGETANTQAGDVGPGEGADTNAPPRGAMEEWISRILQRPGRDDDGARESGQPRRGIPPAGPSN